MQWLGFIISITIYGCIFVALTTARLGWWVLPIWLAPILAMTITYQTGMEINGLMVLICVLMFFLCRRGLVDIQMWNTKQRKKRGFLFGVLYVIVLVLFMYSFAQAQIQGYMLNIQGWSEQSVDIWRLLLTMVPMAIINWFFTQLVFTSIDRLYCKKKELTLLECQFFTASEAGVERGIAQGYYVEGIQNGITYHFRMTRRMFYMLKKEPWLKIKMGVGVFGGYYVKDFDTTDYLKRVRRSDRFDLKLGIAGFLLVAVGVVYAFWFYL